MQRSLALLRRTPFIITVGLLIAAMGLLMSVQRYGGDEDLGQPATGAATGQRSFQVESQQAPFRPESINFTGVEVVALGTVVEALPSRWVTADGKLPVEFRGQEERAFGDSIDLATPVTFQVKEYWKNPQPSPVLLVRSIGGRDGDFEIQYSHATLQNMWVWTQ